MYQVDSRSEEELSIESCNDMCNFHLLRLFPDIETGKKGVENVIFMDMGQHAISDWLEPQLLHQVLVPGLEDRARLTPDLNTFEQITTGKLH